VPPVTPAGPFSHVVVNPATEEAVETVAETSHEEAEAAVRRAVQAAAGWAQVSPADRARLLRAFAGLVDRDVETLARLEVAEAGHPITSARVEAAAVRDVLAYYAGAPERLNGRQIPVAGGLDVTFREPLGVVGVIVPWNFPMPIASWGFAPALAAGNAVLLKPAELTPLTARHLAALALAAGLPEGLLQVLPGRGPVVGRFLVEHEAVRKICFTGSAPVGQAIMAACAAQTKRVTLELGGKSPNIVFADADLERAAATAPYAVFDNAGQDCCARSRILVQRPVFDQFMAMFEAAVKGMVVGDPSDETTEMGPLISAAHRLRRWGRWPRGGRKSSARSPASRPSTPRTRPSRTPTTRRTACPDRSGPRTWAGRCGWRARCRAGTSRSTRTRRCATRRRSAGSSSRGWAASSARTRRWPLPRKRTFSSRPAKRSVHGAT
jgi:acyl-CoA reductase-like NAD-dependent aldehyde dehydrogenase